ncbi:MAG TPA: putative sugar nucleotidyl transferase, partial [Longimicrobiales bacterium]|nr:putative sugar nucleotidyl transferase [Longimicrobiales bacterium]
MNEMTLYLFDDDVARGWQPFALTRPVGELLLGAHTFRARAEQLFGVRCAGHITAPHLTGFAEPEAAPVIDLSSVATDRPRLFLSSRALLDWSAISLPAGASVLRTADAVVGRVVPAGAPNPDAAWLAAPESTGEREVEVAGRVVERVWDLVAENPAQIGRDHEAARSQEGATDAERGGHFHALHYRAGMLHLGAGVVIEPNVVLDFAHGPIWLDDGVTVRAFTRLAGPAYVGRNSTLLGGPYDAVSIGPVCRVHGELEESVVLGYSNKAHDGFLGHAYLGRWVNLGAMTTNSDLKNNYGTIRMWTPAGDVDTGLIKLGCLLGDHVKTGIGALLNTGTVVGAGSNLFGTAMPPKYVPPFSWGSGSALDAYDVEKFLAVTATVMKRRELTLEDG